MRSFLILASILMILLLLFCGVVVAQEDGADDEADNNTKKMSKDDREFFMSLLKDLTSVRYADRKAAKIEIVKMADEGYDIGDDVTKLLDNADFAVRRDAIEILTKIKYKPAAEKMQKIFLDVKEDNTVRDAAYKMLLKIGSSSLDFFVGLLGAEEEGVRENAKEALLRLWKKALPKLEEALDDKNERVRYEVGRLFKMRTYHLLGQFVADPEISAKYVKGYPSARDIVKEEDPEMRRKLFRNEVKRLGKKWMDRMLDAYGDKGLPIEMRVAALYVLGYVDYPETFKLVLAALDAPEAQFRSAALMSIYYRGIFDDPALKKLVREHFKDVEPSVASLAIQLSAVMNAEITPDMGPRGQQAAIGQQMREEVKIAAKLAEDPKTDPKYRFTLSIVVATFMQDYEFLLKKLSDPSPEVRVKVLDVLKNAPAEKKLIDGLIAFLKTGKKTPAEFIATVSLMAPYEKKDELAEAVKISMEYLNEKDIAARCAAIEFLGDAAAKKELDPIFGELLNSTEIKIRISTLKAVGAVAERTDKKIIDAILNSIRKDSEFSVRLTAFLALENIFRAPFDSRSDMISKLQEEPIDAYLQALNWVKNPPEPGEYRPDYGMVKDNLKK